MKKYYNTPELNISKLVSNDVITASGDEPYTGKRSVDNRFLDIVDVNQGLLNYYN